MRELSNAQVDALIGQIAREEGVTRAQVRREVEAALAQWWAGLPAQAQRQFGGPGGAPPSLGRFLAVTAQMAAREP